MFLLKLGGILWRPVNHVKPLACKVDNKIDDISPLAFVRLPQGMFSWRQPSIDILRFEFKTSIPKNEITERTKHVHKCM